MLKEVLESINNQTYKKIEVLIIDDNFKKSEEKKATEKEVIRLKKKYDNLEIIYIQHTDNQGANFARNTGIVNSRGKYITFLDDDDLYLKNRLEVMLKKLKKNDVDMVCCSCKWILKETNEIKKDLSITFDKIIEKQDILTNNVIGGTSLILVKKEVMNKIGKFDITLSSCQDWDLYIRIALSNYKILKIKEQLVNYYLHTGERISTNKRKVIEGHLRIKEKYKKERKELSIKSRILFNLKILKQYLI